MSKPSKKIEAEVLQQFRYDAVNGGVTRVNGRGRGVTPSNNGYMEYRVSVNGLMADYSEHRLVYLLHNPDMQQTLHIDHVNGIKADNRIENLRLVTPQENSFNRPNALGFRWVEGHRKFYARITINGKCIHLGQYETILDARAAYLRAKPKYHVIKER